MTAAAARLLQAAYRAGVSARLDSRRTPPVYQSQHHAAAAAEGYLDAASTPVPDCHERRMAKSRMDYDAGYVLAVHGVILEPFDPGGAWELHLGHKAGAVQAHQAWVRVYWRGHADGAAGRDRNPYRATGNRNAWAAGHADRRREGPAPRRHAPPAEARP